MGCNRLDRTLAFAWVTPSDRSRLAAIGLPGVGAPFASGVNRHDRPCLFSTEVHDGAAVANAQLSAVLVRLVLLMAFRTEVRETVATQMSRKVSTRGLNRGLINVPKRYPPPPNGA